MTDRSPDPVSGDFDHELDAADAADMTKAEPSRDRHLVVQFTLEGDDAAALQRIADDQGEKPAEVVRSLIRTASEKAA